MPERCVATLCNNANDPKPTSVFIEFRFLAKQDQKVEDTKPMGKLRPQKKNELGARKNILAVFSAFTEDDLMRPLNLGAVKIKRELKRNQSDICVFPSRHTV